MALPVSPAPKSRDVAVLGWAGITVRVAWTLLQSGVKVRTDVLRDARAHAILCIDANMPVPHAEDVAAQATRGFVSRARGKRLEDPWPLDARMPLSPRWVRALDRSMDRPTRALFRKHYGDNRSLTMLEQTLGIERQSLEAALGGLREAIRNIGVADGLPFQEWTAERLDRLLVRMAAYAPGPCPPVIDVAEGAHREHVRACARCDRMVRLLRSSILTVDELSPPTLGARPGTRAEVLVVQFHPTQRASRTLFAREVDTRCYPIGDDLLVFDADARMPVDRLLRTACEVGAPQRSELRGAVLRGPGAWSAHGLLGPLVDELDREVQTRSWATIDGFGELPEKLPAAPNARAAWAGVFGLAAIGLVVLRLAWSGAATATEAPELTLTSAQGRTGVWVSFDAPDQDPVGVVLLGPDGLQIAASADDASGKALLATGDGSFRANAPEGILVVHSHDAIDLAALSANLEQSPQPLLELEQRIHASHPRATVRVAP